MRKDRVGYARRMVREPKARRRRRSRLLLLATALILPLVFPGCLDGLFYQPDRIVYRDLEAMPRSEQVTFASADGTPLHGCLLRASGTRRGTVLFFHGNAQNLTSHIGLVDWLPERGFDVFGFDYRGYGRSQGRPSRQGVFEDSVAALRYLRSRADVDGERLFVLGQSLGGACAVAAIASEGGAPVRGVVLDSTFATYQGMGNTVLGGTFLTMPFAWLLLTNGHSPAHGIERLAPTPLLFFHSEADPVVPISQGRALFDAANEPKRFVTLTRPGHPIATSAAEHEQVVRFFDECLAR